MEVKIKVKEIIDILFVSYLEKVKKKKLLK